MRKAWVVVLLIMGCGPIAPYNTRVDPTMSAAPALPVPAALKAYAAGVEQQWAETAKRCTQVEIAIAEEIDDRRRRLTSTKRWLLGIGSIAALTTTIYTGIEDNPKKEVIVPLSAIGGALVVTAIPALTEDDRVTALEEKLVKISVGEGAAIAKLNAIEKELHELAILYDAQSRETTALQDADEANKVSIQARLDSLTLEYDSQELAVTPLEFELRTALAAWYHTCR